MIFILRVIIFSLLILAGFTIAVKSITSRKIVTVIYTFTLLYYTFLCRLPLFTSVPAAADDGLPSQPATTVTLWTRFIRIVTEIFGSQPDGTLAGGGVFVSVVMNCLLFIPCGFLTYMYLCEREEGKFRENRRGRIVAVVIALGISLTIECVQELTGLGMADWKDILGNTLGAGIGVLMVMVYDRHRTVDMKEQ